MRSNWNLSFIVVAMTLLQLCAGTQSEAQELKKALRDYRDDRVFNYQPNDPWYRGKLFNVQTKHYGRYFNCDGEESKRNSPYICWKAHHEKDFPTRYRISDIIRHDLDIVRRRLNDGSCKENCNCQECQQCQAAQTAAPASSCNCLECQGGMQAPAMEYLSETTSRPTSGDRTPQHEVFTASSSPVIVGGRSPRPEVARYSSHLNSNVSRHSAPAAKTNSPKYGLVSGKIVGSLNNTPTHGHSNPLVGRTAGTARTANADNAPWYRQSARESATAKDTLSSSEYFLNLKRR